MTSLALVHNATERAYILSGNLCQDAQLDNCALTPSIEVLDMPLGTWQPFSAPLGRAIELFQVAILDHELSACLGVNGAVNDRLFR